MIIVKRHSGHSLTWSMLISLRHTELKSRSHRGDCPRAQGVIGQSCLHLQVMNTFTCDEDGNSTLIPHIASKTKGTSAPLGCYNGPGVYSTT